MSLTLDPKNKEFAAWVESRLAGQLSARIATAQQAAGAPVTAKPKAQIHIYSRKSDGKTNLGYYCEYCNEEVRLINPLNLKLAQSSRTGKVLMPVSAATTHVQIHIDEFVAKVQAELDDESDTPLSDDAKAVMEYLTKQAFEKKGLKPSNRRRGDGHFNRNEFLRNSRRNTPEW